jgi:hypothetical protein
MAVTSNTIGKEICDALNLDSTKVQNIDIRIHSGEVAHVFVQMAPTRDEFSNLCRVLKHYTLQDEAPGVVDATSLASESREFLVAK